MKTAPTVHGIPGIDHLDGGPILALFSADSYPGSSDLDRPRVSDGDFP